jgi:hypothetical protein
MNGNRLPRKHLGGIIIATAHGATAQFPQSPGLGAVSLQGRTAIALRFFLFSRLAQQTAAFLGKRALIRLFFTSIPHMAQGGIIVAPRLDGNPEPGVCREQMI